VIEESRWEWQYSRMFTYSRIFVERFGHCLENVFLDLSFHLVLGFYSEKKDENIKFKNTFQLIEYFNMLFHC